jgi:hypothetical protein
MEAGDDATMTLRSKRGLAGTGGVLSATREFSQSSRISNHCEALEAVGKRPPVSPIPLSTKFVGCT